MARYLVNGRYLTRQMTGVERFAHELMRCVDLLPEAREFAIAVPTEPLPSVPYANIPMVAVKGKAGTLWEQTSFARTARKLQMTPLNLCNAAPLRHPGVVAIHDMQARANPQAYSRQFATWYHLMYGQITQRAESIITVSEFSRREIERFYPATQGKIAVVSNAWQHIQRMGSDASIFERQPSLEQGAYWFALSSIAPNKNLRWIVETARLNPGETVVVGGGINAKVFGEGSIPEADNVIYLGYLDDEEIKALLEGCKGFLYPTFYEGFGIPPLEALACGAPIVVSDTEVMHEVYGAAAHYVDPHQPCNDLNALLAGAVDGPDSVLSRYSWEASAQRLCSLLLH